MLHLIRFSFCGINVCYAWNMTVPPHWVIRSLILKIILKENYVTSKGTDNFIIILVLRYIWRWAIDFYPVQVFILTRLISFVLIFGIRISNKCLYLSWASKTYCLSSSLTLSYAEIVISYIPPGHEW